MELYLRALPVLKDLFVGFLVGKVAGAATIQILFQGREGRREGGGEERERERNTAC